MIYKDYIQKHAAEAPREAVFLLREGQERKEITWERFFSDINALGTGLVDGHPGARIGILGENSYQWALIHMTAVLGAGAAVPLDRDQREDTLASQIRTTECSLVFYSAQYRKKARRLEEMLDKTCFICWDEEEFDKMLELGNAELERGNDQYISLRPGEEDLACIIFTSGTTGGPKGVMLSQKNIVSMVSAALELLDLAPGDRCLLVLPLYHCYGCFYNLYAGLAARCVQCICPDLKRVSQQIVFFQARILFLVPVVVEALLTELERSGMSAEEFFGGSLKWVMSAGAPISPQIIKRFGKHGVDVLNGYGITECTAIVSLNPRRAFRADTVGLPGKNWDVKIAEDGEICVSGSNVMMGYYGDGESRQAVMDGPWFRTGDLGYLDQDGHLVISGRKKNLIILSNGKNVSPEELEEQIHRMEGVKEVLVYEKDQKITAEVYTELSEEALSAEMVLLNRKLPAYDRIQQVLIRDTAFEKTGGQKIKRRR